jgi:hypothetical protein
MLHSLFATTLRQLLYGQRPDDQPQPSTGENTLDTRCINSSHERCRAQITFTFARFFGQDMADESLVPPDLAASCEPKALGCTSVGFHFRHTRYSGSSGVVSPILHADSGPGSYFDPLVSALQHVDDQKDRALMVSCFKIHKDK